MPSAAPATAAISAKNRKPLPGKLFVRAVETDESMGRVILLPKTRERWTAGQYEVVALGDTEPCDDCEDCFRTSTTLPDGHESHPWEVAVGDWVILNPRMVVHSDVDGLYVTHAAALLARLTVS